MWKIDSCLVAILRLSDIIQKKEKKIVIPFIYLSHFIADLALRLVFPFLKRDEKDDAILKNKTKQLIVCSLLSS